MSRPSTRCRWRFCQEGLDEILLDLLNLPHYPRDMSQLGDARQTIKHPRHKVRIGIVGKYVELPDAYKSLNEALMHGGVANDSEVELVYISAEQIETEQLAAGDLRGRRPAGAHRLRPARHRGQDPGDSLRPRAQGAFLRHLPRHAVPRHRVPAQRLWHQGRDLGRVQPRRQGAGDLHAARPARRRGHGRHHAPRRLSLRAARGNAGTPDLRPTTRSASATAIATRSTRSTCPT